MADLKKLLERLFMIFGLLLTFSYIPILLLKRFLNDFNNLSTDFIPLFTIIGFILLVIGIVLSGFTNKVKNGILVIGNIVSVKRTGKLLNHQPQLDITVEFTTNEGQQITASERRFVSLTDLAQFQPKKPIPIQYDSENPQNIMIDDKADQKALQDAYNSQMLAKGVTSKETLDIVNNGVEAKGVVLSAEPTGNIINDMGEMSLHIKVTRPDSGDTFEAFVNKVMPRNSLSSTLPGSVIDVFYLPEDESKIAISLNFS